MIMMQSIIAQDDAIVQCKVRKAQLKVKGYRRDLRLTGTPGRPVKVTRIYMEVTATDENGGTHTLIEDTSQGRDQPTRLE